MLKSTMSFQNLILFNFNLTFNDNAFFPSVQLENMKKYENYRSPL